MCVRVHAYAYVCVFVLFCISMRGIVTVRIMHVYALVYPNKITSLTFASTKWNPFESNSLALTATPNV